ncbi:MAG: hypothetical protein ACOCUV_00700 [bacterium]
MKVKVFENKQDYSIHLTLQELHDLQSAVLWGGVWWLKAFSKYKKKGPEKKAKVCREISDDYEKLYDDLTAHEKRV